MKKRRSSNHKRERRKHTSEQHIISNRNFDSRRKHRHMAEASLRFVSLDGSNESFIAENKKTKREVALLIQKASAQRKARIRAVIAPRDGSEF